MPDLDDVLIPGEQKTLVAIAQGEELPDGGFWKQNLLAGRLIDSDGNLTEEGQELAEILSEKNEGESDDTPGD